MKLAEIIQLATRGSTTSAIVFVLNNTSSIAAHSFADRQPVQTLNSVPIFMEDAGTVGIEPQLLLFERNPLAPVIAAPLWLLQRMKALQQMQPPTLQEVETSFRAVEEMRSNYEGNQGSFINGRKISDA